MASNGRKQGQAMMIKEWTILKEGSSEALNFTSLLNMSVELLGKALSNPVEEGAFSSYNKTLEPVRINVSLAKQGQGAELEITLEQIEGLRKSTEFLSLITPMAFYEKLTLESYTYEFSKENGAGSLIVNLKLVEVRESSSLAFKAFSLPRLKRASSATKIDIGRLGVEKLSDILFHGIKDI